MKNRLIKKLGYLASALIISATGCKKTENSTTDPSAPSTTAPQVTLVGTLRVPVKPASIPTTIQHLIISDDYSVEVKESGTSNYQEVPVYKTDNYAVVSGSDRRSQASASFANFSFAPGTSVDVRITMIKTAISNYKVRPLSYNINLTKVNDYQVTYTISSPRKVHVEINDRQNPLFVFGNPPEPVAETAVGGTTYTYEPGTVTDIGFRKVIHTNDRINIRAGAIVQGTFLLDKNATNVKFIGQGILTSGNVNFGADPNTQVVKNSTFAGAGDFYSGANNVTWEGLNIVNAAGWVFGCVQGFSTTTHLSHHNVFKDLKEVNWNPQTDVMWFDGDYNTVRDCFFFANDDITTHGSFHCTLSNIVVWQGGNGGHLFMHYNYSNSDDITYDGIDIIGNDNVVELIKVWAGGTNIVSINNVTFKNINLEERSAPGSYFKNRLIKFYPSTTAGRYDLANWNFTNIKINAQQPGVPSNDSEGILDPTGSVTGLNFSDFYYGATKMTSLSQSRITKNANVATPIFQ